MSTRAESGFLVSEQPVHQTSGIFAALKDFINRIFGCWHKEMSRPFTIEGETYRVCLHCGARRQFKRESWETQGRYYFEDASPARTRGQVAPVKISRLPNEQLALPLKTSFN
ncbi:MAG: hypothetical protein AB1757_06595 [Acidobacteriota bacterium]